MQNFHCLLDFLHMKDLLPEHPQIRIIWLCMYELIFCLTLSAFFLSISNILDFIGLKFRYKKLLNWVWHSAGNMIPVLKSDEIACFLLCVISFSLYHLHIDTTCHHYPSQNTLKGVGGEGRCQIDLHFTLMEWRQRYELNWVTLQMNLFLSVNNSDFIETKSGHWNVRKSHLVSKRGLRRA